MANRLVFNNINRKIHFYAGFVILIFVLFYPTTGFIMTKFKWFKGNKIKTTVDHYVLNYRPDTTNLAKFGDEIRQQFDLSGRIEYKRNPNNTISYVIYRPGIRNEILVRQELDSIVIKRIENVSLQQISTRLHRLYGFSGGWKYVIWAVILDITAISIILFAVTGLLIWFKHRKAYKWGWIVILPTLIFTLIMFYYLK